MRVAIVRRLPKASFSMDVYADGLVSGLKAVRPDWEIIELTPRSYSLTNKKTSWLQGIEKYYERYWRYPATVRQQVADVFHIIDHSDAHIVQWLRKTNQPVVVTCHDLINFIYPENIQDQAKLPVVSMAAWKYAIKGLKQSDRIICVSNHTAKDAMQLLHTPAARLKVVHNGVESDFYPLPAEEILAFRQQQGLTPDTICLLNVGSNHPRKNVITILQVLEILNSQGMRIHFWKTGADFTKEQKTFIQKHNLNSCIKYLGKPDKNILRQIYNAADILLAPSVYEGFGITILEAMACQTAVISSNVTSLPEVVGDAGILVEPLDVSAMVEAIQQIQQDSSYHQQLIERGLVRAKEFTWEKAASQVAEVYESLVGVQRDYSLQQSMV
ncbi:glycosyltransferase family 4 protein [Fischerella sp. NIES-3754]|uniref:glycosyltransferase family 4 protein n=1 Tax=Fischerella sp. NIES-3754 TaxID=1752063 RepID=UPI0007230410|nr:glycosyltransferase family 1 protein [Fischerella sp. NIES-3754]BAU05794.1 glycosyl transferase, group 1 [Fischerella sp. NIES-3754]BCX08070.1 MAG: mannosyltransferase [Fischerella sp.]